MYIFARMTILIVFICTYKVAGLVIMVKTSVGDFR